MWVFGYGSIIWRPGFEWVERRPGYIEGWTRRFWQHSTDHRGVPDAPGRVVTLLPEPSARCWGVAFRVCGREANRIARQLDVREKGGYERHHVDVHTPHHDDRDDARETGPVEDALMYVATRDNPHFAGPAPLSEMAAQILRSEGPSGPNVEYLLELADGLRDIGAEDPHVFELAEHVRGQLRD